MKQLTLHLNDATLVLALDAMTLGRQTTIVEQLVGTPTREEREITEEIELRIPIYRSLDLLPGASEFIAWLHYSEARQA